MKNFSLAQADDASLRRKRISSFYNNVIAFVTLFSISFLNLMS
jgi:hypothetical protein